MTSAALALALCAAVMSSPATAASARAASIAGVAETSSLPAPNPGAEVYPRPADGVYDITGGGYGHGVGMSQYGAQGAALKGLTHDQILAFYYPGTQLVQGGLTTIRVGITVDSDGVLAVSARAGLSVTIQGATSALPTGRTQWRVRATGTTASTCLVEGYDGKAWTAYRTTATPCPVSFSSSEGTVDVLLPSGERRVLRGAVAAVHTGSTKLATVNTLPTQSYLRGVVPSEMPPSWHREALEAQAVAARTYASRRSNGTSYYDTCDTTACQVYRGAGKRNSDGSVTSYEYAAVDAAITATNGQVLTFRFSDGVTRLATTMYSSSNGGYSTAAGNGHTYMPAKADSYDGVSINKRHSWSAQLPVSALESRFGIARVERVQILARTGSGSWGGRVTSVLVEGYTSDGSYVSASTTGNGIVSARPWPANSTGLSSNYFTIGTTSDPSGAVSRIAGSDRFATAAKASEAYAPGVAVVYVASGLDFPDALAGSARAGYNDAPVLLTRPDSVPAATTAAMQRLKPGRVVVLGGPDVVSNGVAETLRSLTTSGSLQRVGGADRFATAADLASYYPTGGAVAYVASGLDFPDALASAAAAGHDRAPVLLTLPIGLPAPTAAALQRLRPSTIVVVGGPAAVSDAVVTALRPYATGGTVTRVSGSDRYATAAAVAARLSSATSVYVAGGNDFPDALVGAAPAGRAGAPVLLTRPNSLPAATAAQVERLAPSRAYVLGGSAVVGDAVATSLAQLLD